MVTEFMTINVLPKSGAVETSIGLKGAGNALSKDFKRRFKNFEEYLDNQLIAVTNSLARSGITETRKQLRAAKTEWGQARMAGIRFGVKFAPEGRSEGREKSGFMYDSVSSRVDVGKDRGGLFIEGFFGWPGSVTRSNAYIVLQEFGFYSTGSFDPVATARSGRARFKEGRLKFIQGAASLPKARREVGKRAASAYSAAWNEAVRRYNADGFAGNPPKPNSRKGSRGRF
jgi:hypothetical protein